MIGAIGDPLECELVLSAILRLDPILRNSSTLPELLTDPVVGCDEAGIDDLFERQSAPDRRGLTHDRPFDTYPDASAGPNRRSYELFQ